MEKGKVHFHGELPYVQLIDYFEGECLLEKAIEAAGHAIRQFPYSVDFQVRKAEVLLENREPKEALAILDKAALLSPGFLPIALRRAEGIASLGMAEEAIEMLHELKSGAEAADLSSILVCEALIYEHLKEFETMFYVLKVALEEDPSNKEALTRMWFCVEHARKYEQSVELHQAILDEDPFNSLAWYNLGAAHHYLCNHEEAIEAYEYAFLTNENFEFAYRDCAEVCTYLKDYRKALQCYQEVLERFEPDADLFLHIGECYFKLNNYLVSRTFYEKALHFDRYSSEAHFQIGQCFAREKSWQKAISSYLKAIRIEDCHELYHAGLAEAYCQVGDYKKAEIYFREAADTAPEDAQYWNRLAKFLMERSRQEEALDILEEAEEYCFDPELLYFRSACLFSLDRKKEALHALEDALTEDFDAKESLFNLLPVLENDQEVKAVIAVYQPEN